MKCDRPIIETVLSENAPELVPSIMLTENVAIDPFCLVATGFLRSSSNSWTGAVKRIYDGRRPSVQSVDGAENFRGFCWWSSQNDMSVRLMKCRSVNVVGGVSQRLLLLRPVVMLQLQGVELGVRQRCWPVPI